MIDALDVFSYSLPLRGAVRAGSQHHTVREGVCVRLASENAYGWGEAAPLPGFSAETLQEVGRSFFALRTVLPARVDDLLDGLRYPSARFALDTAYRELAARRRERQSLIPPEEIRHARLQLAALTGDEGDGSTDALRNRVLKVKVGNPDWRADAERVARAREVVGSDSRIRLDANRRWTAEQASAFLGAVASFKIDFIEEPVSKLSDLEALATAGVAVALDETLQEIVAGGCPDGRSVAQQAFAVAPSASVLVVKPALLGTWSVVTDLYAAAAEAGWRVVISSAYEAGIGVRALIALASMNPAAEAVGLDPYNRFAEDVLSPRLALEGSEVDVASQMALDRTVRVEALQPWSER